MSYMLHLSWPSRGMDLLLDRHHHIRLSKSQHDLYNLDPHISMSSLRFSLQSVASMNLTLHMQGPSQYAKLLRRLGMLHHLHNLLSVYCSFSGNLPCTLIHYASCHNFHHQYRFRRQLLPLHRLLHLHQLYRLRHLHTVQRKSLIQCLRLPRKARYWL